MNFEDMLRQENEIVIYDDDSGYSSFIHEELELIEDDPMVQEIIASIDPNICPQVSGDEVTANLGPCEDLDSNNEEIENISGGEDLVSPVLPSEQEEFKGEVDTNKGEDLDAPTQEDIEKATITYLAVMLATSCSTASFHKEEMEFKFDDDSFSISYNHIVTQGDPLPKHHKDLIAAFKPLAILVGGVYEIGTPGWIEKMKETINKVHTKENRQAILDTFFDWVKNHQ